MSHRSLGRKGGREGREWRREEGSWREWGREEVGGRVGEGGRGREGGEGRKGGSMREGEREGGSGEREGGREGGWWREREVEGEGWYGGREGPERRSGSLPPSSPPSLPLILFKTIMYLMIMYSRSVNLLGLRRQADRQHYVILRHRTSSGSF